MRVKRLSMKNFRGVHDLTLEFSQTEPTIIIGVNGVGKSSILECLALQLRTFVDHIPNIQAFANIEGTDVFHGAEETKIEILIEINSKEGRLSARKSANGATISGLVDGDLASPGMVLGRDSYGEEYYSNQLTEELKHQLEIRELPLTVYYSAQRTVAHGRSNISKSTDVKPIDAYKDSLGKYVIYFEDFFEWIQDKSIQDRSDNLNQSNRQLVSIQKAIYSLVPDFQNLKIQHFSHETRMTVRKQDLELTLNQLSGGEQCLLFMVGDLARRLAIANPGLDDPLQGAGVILIDEIELHLHPGWQYEIIPALTRTFPNCQFIVTTHSPIVLSQVKPEGIFCLEKEKDGKVIAYHPDSSYGRDVNQIVEDLMGVPSRPIQFQQKILELFRLIDAGDLDGAKQQREELANEMGADEPELVKANVSIRRKEILNK
jgi:predicted ATP-binding protein involved in virulence